MEGLTATAYRGWRGYWNRRGYVRLTHQLETVDQLHLRGGELVPYTGDNRRSSRRRRRFLKGWKVKLRRPPKIRAMLSAPKRWLTKLRDAYVNMMLGIANSAACRGGGYGGGGFIGRGGGYGGGGFGRPAMKEYDERMIVEIYKSILMAQGQMVPVAACDGNGRGKASAQIVWGGKSRNLADF